MPSMVWTLRICIIYISIIFVFDLFGICYLIVVLNIVSWRAYTRAVDRERTENDVVHMKFKNCTKIMCI